MYRKITTPEHIVDKGTKLETIYNRIHEVRMRFEVLLRDAKLDYYEKLLVNPEQKQQLQQQLDAQIEKLHADFSFIAACNVGGEFMDESQLNRLHQIASIKWYRHFDASLGLSPLEELRMVNLKDQTLPVEELLLSDKPSDLTLIKRLTADEEDIYIISGANKTGTFAWAISGLKTDSTGGGADNIINNSGGGGFPAPLPPCIRPGGGWGYRPSPPHPPGPPASGRQGYH